MSKQNTIKYLKYVHDQIDKSDEKKIFNEYLKETFNKIEYYIANTDVDFEYNNIVDDVNFLYTTINDNFKDISKLKTELRMKKLKRLNK